MTGIADGLIDVLRLQLVLSEELRRFEHDFDLSPVPEIQEARAFLIAWVAVVLPEAITPHLLGRLETISGDIHLREDFLHSGWYRTLPLDATIFALTEDPSWIRIHKLNVDHHNSSLRSIVIESLAVVADKLNFDDPELQTRTAENLRNANFYCEWSAIVLLVARGDLQTKRERLRYWQELCSLNPDVGERLGRLAKGEPVSNPLLFLFLWIQQYVSLRLMESAQPVPPFGPIQLELPQHYEVPLSQQLWHRLRNHPLTASHIYLEGITRE